MWDYDKLFAENNVVGLTIEDGEKVYNQVVSNPDYWNDGQNVNWDLYKNNQLSSYEETGFKFEIQYIIRLDEHGNVVEKLFDRERDMKSETKPMPELETGMFVRVEDECLGYVDTKNNRIVYQHGGYDVLNADEYFLNVLPKIIEVYSESACAFSYCNDDVLIWRDPDYQAYLDSKYK